MIWVCARCCEEQPWEGRLLLWSARDARRFLKGICGEQFAKKTSRIILKRTGEMRSVEFDVQLERLCLRSSSEDIICLLNLAELEV